jgi:signal transduction histidine kinase
VAVAIKPLDVSKALDDTLTLFQHYEKYRGRIAVERHDEKDLWVQMDGDHLQQILLNLLLNAAEAIGEKSGTIRVKAYRDQEGHTRLSVRDDGEGMEESRIKNIFDPFFTTKSKGTGLGLSIVLRIIEAYNGQINVKSEKGAGSIFTVIL